MSRLVEFLLHYHIQGSVTRDAAIVSPNNLLFMKFVGKYVHGVARAWDRTTLLLDGATSDPPDECKRRLDTSIAALKDFKANRKISADLHDAANIALKLLKFARWCLTNDQNATVEFTFPRTRARLSLILAARSFKLEKETTEQRAQLKKALGADRIAPVRGAPDQPAAVVFQTPTEFLLLNFYGVTRWDKQDMTQERLIALLRESQYGYQPTKDFVFSTNAKAVLR